MTLDLRPPWDQCKFLRIADDSNAPRTKIDCALIFSCDRVTRLKLDLLAPRLFGNSRDNRSMFALPEPAPGFCIERICI